MTVEHWWSFASLDLWEGNPLQNKNWPWKIIVNQNWPCKVMVNQNWPCKVMVNLNWPCNEMTNQNCHCLDESEMKVSCSLNHKWQIVHEMSPILQGTFGVCTQPMSDDVTLLSSMQFVSQVTNCPWYEPHVTGNIVYVPSQWAMMLHCNVVSHWLGAYTKWSGKLCDPAMSGWCTRQCKYRYQAPVPLKIFRSNSKFDQNLQCSGLKCTPPITTKFCTRHDSVTVVTHAKFCCDRLSIF